MNRLKAIVTLTVLLLMAIYSPSTPVDPWELFSPRKVSMMIFALALVQVCGALLVRALGPKAGALLGGFFGGLVSSTATTAALAKRSKDDGPSHTTQSHLMFLAATGAMLTEGLVLILTGTTGIHWELLMILGVPMAMLAILILRLAQSAPDERLNATAGGEFRILPLLKLAVFIVLILALSKILQRTFGQNGLLVLTFLVSLFEVHGSLIANVQLHDTGAIDLGLLESLVAVSLLASMLSKLFLVVTIGSKPLRKLVTKTSLAMATALLIGWSISKLVPAL